MQPWVEKYRPARLDDVQAQQESVAALRSCLRAGSNMPHLLFFGPAGTGKTSSILALARDLFGPDFLKTRVKELNASDDRGIEVVRQKVKTFARGSVSSLTSRVQSDGRIYPLPAFKLIILDEADALLPDAQAALRRMMEDFSDVTRFCILCNYVSRIIDPISSRCAKFRFKPVDRECLASRVGFIATQEGLTLSEEAINGLSAASKGDLRTAITLLQTAVRAKGADLRGETFVDLAGLVPTAVMQSLTEVLCRGHFSEIFPATKRVLAKGYSALQVVGQIRDYLVSPECALPTLQRALLCTRVSLVEKRLLDRADEMLQLLDLTSAFALPATI